MNDYQIEKFSKKIREEYTKFIDYYAVNKTVYEVLDEIDKVYTYTRLFEYLLQYSKHFNYKYLPTENILETYYIDFVRTRYELTNDDLKEFFNDEMQNVKQELFLYDGV